MTLAEYAENELRNAGAYDNDADYGGIGKQVMELIATFRSQGHSGSSAQTVLDAFNRVARYKPLSPLKDPMTTGEYIEHEGMLQSTRDSAIMSSDGGKSWFDVSRQVPLWMRLRGVKVYPVRGWLTHHKD